MARSSAPGKLILCGEHAVVYGQPAIALPVAAVAATATVMPEAGGGIVVALPDLHERWRLDEHPEHPLAGLIRRTLDVQGVSEATPLAIVLESTIPIASGMGSGAALGAALVQALARHFGRPLDAATVSELVYESERFYHGTPSGIDNTVVSFAQPIWYQRDTEGAPPRIEPLAIPADLTLVVGDTGVRCPTRVTVGGVRERANADPSTYHAYFRAIGEVVAAVRVALAHGNIPAVGALLDENHRLLQAIGVSSPALERLIDAARTAGASGAKLSGGGGGGIMLALAAPERAEPVATALNAAGAARVIVTGLARSDPLRL